MTRLKGWTKIRIQKRQTLQDGLMLATKIKNNRITEKQFARKFAKLKESVIFETLTGLFTPYFFEIELKREIAIARRFRTPLCLMIVDMDKLKHTNDTHGHTVGNKAILLLAKTILKHVREEDIPCRWGGDEFAIILPYTEIKDALLVADRIKNLIAISEVDTGKGMISITASIGIAKFETLDSPASIFNKADLAVYKVKRTGRGEVAVFDPKTMMKKGERL